LFGESGGALHEKLLSKHKKKDTTFPSKS